MSARALLAAALRAHAARRLAMGERRIDAAPAGARASHGATPAAAPTAEAFAPHSHPPPPPPAREDRAEARSVAVRTEERSSVERMLPAAGTAAAPGTPAALAPACADLAALRAAVAECRACRLCETRTQTVFADGPLIPDRVRVMFIGEAPGFYEDRQGVPFVGKAGALLTDIITKGMRLRREDVYIANVLKCRPPDNRDPQADEKALCTAWLDRQIELVDPEVLIPLGRHAANHLLGTDAPMGRLRGRVHEVRGRKVVPTFHPAYLLRSPGDKRLCWEDVQLAMGLLGLPSRPSGGA